MQTTIDLMDQDQRNTYNAGRADYISGLRPAWTSTTEGTPKQRAYAQGYKDQAPKAAR